MCLLGDKCTFAHGMTDMTSNAKATQQAKVATASLGFMPLQAMGRSKPPNQQLH